MARKISYDDHDGNDLVHLRDILNCSQRELANFLHISQPMLALVEKGQRNLPAHARPSCNALSLAVSSAIESGTEIRKSSSKKTMRSYLIIEKRRIQAVL